MKDAIGNLGKSILLKNLNESLDDVRNASMLMKTQAAEKLIQQMVSIVTDQQNRIEQLERKINGS